MPHLATLQNARFDQDVDDVRGATLYGEEEQKLGKIDDVVFDHTTGDISYLVVDIGHNRHVLVSVDGVWPSIDNDTDLDSDYSAEELASLPAFDEKVLKHDDQWKAYEKLHREAIKRDYKEGQQAFKRGWEQDPVQHNERNLAHNITPVDVPSGQASSTSSNSASQINAADLYPRRITGTPFTDPAPSSKKLTMTPQGASLRAENQEPVRHNLEGRWGQFQNHLRRNLNSIRSQCGMCSAADDRAA